MIDLNHCHHFHTTQTKHVGTHGSTGIDDNEINKTKVCGPSMSSCGPIQLVISRR